MWENLQHGFQRYFVDNGASEWWINGLKTTILVTLLALCIGVVLGFLVALIRSAHEQTGKLKLLKEWEEYKNSMYFWILTPEHDYRYEIFSVQYTDASSDVYTLFSEPGTLFVDYLETMQSQSEIPVEERTFTAEDKVVTLSTCSSSNGDGRFVVQGVQVPY